MPALQANKAYVGCIALLAVAATGAVFYALRRKKDADPSVPVSNSETFNSDLKQVIDSSGKPSAELEAAAEVGQNVFGADLSRPTPSAKASRPQEEECAIAADAFCGGCPQRIPKRRRDLNSVQNHNPKEQVSTRHLASAENAVGQAAATPAFFWSEKEGQCEGRWHVFSNWYPASFQDPDSGERYVNTEQYMMAKKALLFGDETTHQAIMQTADPRKVKALGRQVACFDSAVWEKHCYQIVFDGNRLKFTQDDDLKGVLLSTGVRPIVEASPYDSVWGIGLAEAQARRCPADQWPGRNLLGKVLMDVRDELRRAPSGPGVAGSSNKMER